MIEVKILIREQMGGIRVTGTADNKDGPSTVLENEYAEKLLPLFVKASNAVEKEMGFDQRYVFSPLTMIRNDGRK